MQLSVTLPLNADAPSNPWGFATNNISPFKSSLRITPSELVATTPLLKQIGACTVCPMAFANNGSILPLLYLAK
jgi:hypothetical protein